MQNRDIPLLYHMITGAFYLGSNSIKDLHHIEALSKLLQMKYWHSGIHNKL